MKWLNNLVVDFGFASPSAVADSLFPSSRHGISAYVVAIGVVSTACSSLFGLNAVVTFAFVNALLLEFVTGIAASLVDGRSFSSTKLFRFLFKLFIVLDVLFIVWQFVLFYDKKSVIVYQLFSGLHTMLVVIQTLEYLISVTENLETITGKSTSRLSGAINKVLNRLLNRQNSN